MQRIFFTAFLSISAIGFFVSACQPLAPGPSSTLTAPQVAPTPTDTPVGSNQAACFKTYSDPIAFTPDHSRILVEANTGVQVYNLKKQAEERFLKSPTNLNRPNAALSPNGETLAWALEDNTIQLVRVADEKVLHTLVGHTGPITKLRFSQTGDRLFSAADDGWVRVWNMDGAQVNAFQPGGGEVLGIGVSADGATLATIPPDGPVKLWDTKDFRKSTELGGTGGYDTSDAAFSPDGHFVAADLATGLSVWDAANRTLAWGGVNSMAFAFSPAGNLLAYADIGDNNKIVLVSPDGKQKLNTLESHQSPVSMLIFSPDGSLLASADDMEIRIWRVEDGRLLYIGKSACP